jgi:hypothetical protein
METADCLCCSAAVVDEPTHGEGAAKIGDPTEGGEVWLLVCWCRDKTDEAALVAVGELITQEMVEELHVRELPFARGLQVTVESALGGMQAEVGDGLG